MFPMLKKLTRWGFQRGAAEYSPLVTVPANSVRTGEISSGMSFATAKLIKLKHWALPHSCILCQAICQNRDICIPCVNELPYCQITCPQCGLTLLNQAEPRFCGKCLIKPPPFNHTIALCEYKAPLTHLIANLKFHKKLIYSRVLGEIMAESLAQYYQNKPLPASIIPVPLHKKRLQERGYNQALELARPIAKQLALPLLTHACIRNRVTQTQSSLSLEEREKNMKGAFSLTGEAVGKHIAILDDVITTGNTVTEMSQLFKKAGIETITLWCLARSNRENDSRILKL